MDIYRTFKMKVGAVFEKIVFLVRATKTLRGYGSVKKNAIRPLSHYKETERLTACMLSG